MAAVLNGQEDAIRFKLFGTTIALRRGEAKEESDKAKEEEKKQEIIPCPRCKSMETKFCYFNNYNVNQPRHFCKGCQRFWTAGGSQRNVSVGAGRRKAKSPSHGVAGCLLSTTQVNQFDLAIGVEEWHMIVQSGYREFFTDAKRQRNNSGGKSQVC